MHYGPCIELLLVDVDFKEVLEVNEPINSVQIWVWIQERSFTKIVQLEIYFI